MKRSLGIVLVAAAVIAGLAAAYALRGSFAGPNAVPTTPLAGGEGPTATAQNPTATAQNPTATAQSPTAPTPTPNGAVGSQGLLIRPGAIGDARIGMTKQQALDTGYFNADVSFGQDCEYPLVWKKPYTNFGVGLTEDDKVAYLEAYDVGAATAEGIGVNSAYAEVKKAYPNLRIKKNPYDQPIALVNEGSKWMGFRFTAEKPQQLTADSMVVAVAVTDGSAPEMAYDGC